jgi:hypothetical protein
MDDRPPARCGWHTLVTRHSASALYGGTYCSVEFTAAQSGPVALYRYRSQWGGDLAPSESSALRLVGGAMVMGVAVMDPTPSPGPQCSSETDACTDPAAIAALCECDDNSCPRPSLKAD